MKLSPSAYKYLGKLPLLTVFSRPLRSAPGALKRVTDFLVAAGLLTVFAPIGLMIAISLAATSKEGILVNKRYRNFDGSDLDLLEFRTRNSDSDRPTALGEFLEAMHLHHWPSLFNVLKGQVSIVGPAPNTEISEGEVGQYERVANAYCLRHKIKPGLTGWAQIHGLTKAADSPEGVENRVKYELEYVDRVGWLFDLSIMLKTPFAWIRNERPEYMT
jgi:lipopolysaccharide/colanic/teichoic acid biosynthesis glycosyltransferase